MSSAVLTARPPRRVWLWGVEQLMLFVRLIIEVVIMGLVMAILERRFDWRAFVIGLFVLVGLTAAVGVAAFGDVGVPREYRDLVLWGGWFATLALGGAVIARTGRRVGYWECYLAAIVLTALVAVHFA